MTSSPKPAVNQSQWAITWRQFRKRKLALGCAGIVICLITVSIFAPLLANDRPLFYRGMNRSEYRNSVRTFRELLSRLSTTDELTDAQKRELKSSANLQARLIAQALPDEAATDFLSRRDQAFEAIEAGDADVVRRIRNEIQQDFGGRDVPLASRNYFPVFASLGGVEIGFIVWNMVLLLFPLWFYLLNRFLPYERTTERAWAHLICWFGLPVLAGCLWWWTVPPRNDRSNYKAAVLASDEDAATALIVYETVMWPPVPYGIDENDLAQKLAKPIGMQRDEEKVAALAAGSRWNSRHWLGTDSLGRDVVARMVWGGRVSLSVGIVAVSIYVTLGIIIGAIAGYFRGVVDLVISRIIEIVICFPAFFLILTIVAFVGPSIFNIMVVIGLTGWTGIARLIRGEFLRLVDQEFVLAGRALGYSDTRLIFKHILPNAVAPVMVSATFGVAGAILTESALSFLGLGISVPTPSWGSMLHTGRTAMEHAPWLIWYPGLAIFVTISCYNLVGEALRDASDPRLRGSR